MPKEESLESKSGCETVLKAQDMTTESTLISGRHLLLRELKQHVQVRVTWSESKFMIWNEAVGEKSCSFITQLPAKKAPERLFIVKYFRN